MVKNKGIEIESWIDEDGSVHPLFHPEEYTDEETGEPACRVHIYAGINDDPRVMKLQDKLACGPRLLAFAGLIHAWLGAAKERLTQSPMAADTIERLAQWQGEKGIFATAMERSGLARKTEMGYVLVP